MRVEAEDSRALSPLESPCRSSLGILYFLMDGETSNSESPAPSENHSSPNSERTNSSSCARYKTLAHAQSLRSVPIRRPRRQRQARYTVEPAYLLPTTRCGAPPAVAKIAGISISRRASASGHNVANVRTPPLTGNVSRERSLGADRFLPLFQQEARYDPGREKSPVVVRGDTGPTLEREQ